MSGLARDVGCNVSDRGDSLIAILRNFSLFRREGSVHSNQEFWVGNRRCSPRVVSRHHHHLLRSLSSNITLTTMAKIHVERTHTLGLAAARAAADRVAAELHREHNIQPRWEGDTLTVRKTGIRGELAVSDDSVVVHVTLGLRMRIFRGTMAKEIIEQPDGQLAIGALT